MARPARPAGRAAFVSGKRKQNTIKTAPISDGEGRTLWCGAVRPGRMHDRTAMRTEGIAEQFRLCPRVKAEAGEGYRGLASEFPDQVSAPPVLPAGPVGIIGLLRSHHDDGHYRRHRVKVFAPLRAHPTARRS